MLRIDWTGESFDLHPQAAVFWRRRRMALITDPHFGKDATFRSASIPVPGGTTDRDLNRLDAVIRDTAAERLLILGDFFHSAASQESATLAALRRWRRQHHALQITLVRGNHDLHSGDPPEDLGIRCVAEDWHEPPLRFCHHPADDLESHPKGAAYFAGHIHPAIALHDADGGWLRARCFLIREQLFLLPAFGGFTGSKTIAPRPGDRVFLLGDGEVMEIPCGPPRRTPTTRRPLPRRAESPPDTARAPRP